MMGVLALFGGAAASFATVASAQSTPTASQTAHWGMPRHGQQMATGHFGVVSAISGTTITMTEGTATYTVTAGSATFTKNGATATIADIKVGDTIAVEGTVSGTNVTATKVMDGMPPHGMRHAPLGNDGTVTAINGTTITMQEEADEGGAIYSVDASKATFVAKGVGGTIADIKVGNKIMVHGTVNGTSVTATEIMDGFGAHMGFGKGPRARAQATNTNGTTTTQ